MVFASVLIVRPAMASLLRRTTEDAVAAGVAAGMAAYALKRQAGSVIPRRKQ